MADFNEIATQFVDHYYRTFDADRRQLAPLYREGSMLTFQSAQTLGAAAIADKLATLPFQKVQHQISARDVQPTPSGGIVILVTGMLLVDEEQNPLGYSQFFHLTQDPSGVWFVQNDIFTLAI